MRPRLIERLPVLIGSLSFVVLWGTAFWVLQERHVPLLGPDEEVPRVNVRWAAGVSDAVRGRREQSLGLESPEHREGRTWSYSIPRGSRAALRRIVASPEVEDTHGIDVKTLSLSGQPRPNLVLAAVAGLAAGLIAGVFAVCAAVWRAPKVFVLGVRSGFGYLALGLTRVVPFSAVTLTRPARGLLTKHPAVLRGILLFAGAYIGTLLAIESSTPAPEPPTVRIRWSPEVSASERTRIEQRFELQRARLEGGRTWSYEAHDWSTQTIRQLLRVPQVEDTQGIDRGTGEVLAAPVSNRAWGRSFAATWIVFGGGWLAYGLWRRRDSVVVRDAIAGVTVFVVSAVVILANADLTNDHFMHLSMADRIVDGEVIQRDFVDLGAPLQVYASAFAQVVGNETLLSEVLLCAFGLAFGLALATRIAKRLSGSWIPPVAAAAVCLTLDYRLYSYPKLAVYAVALWLALRFLRVPRVRGAALMGIIVGVGFLFRHDHGVYLGSLAVLALGLAYWRVREKAALYWSTAFAAALSALVVPYLLFVQGHLGLESYLRAGVNISQREYTRTSLRGLPVFEIDPARLLWESEPIPPEPRPIVNVAWSEGLAEEDRVRVEQEYGLGQGRRLSLGDGQSGRGVWTYRPASPIPADLRRLAVRPEVLDTHGFDRSTGQIIPVRESLHRSLQRRLPFLRWRFLPGLIRPENVTPWLFYLSWGLALTALPVAGVILLRDRARTDAQGVALVAVLALMLNAAFLRSGLAHRLADVVVPGLILASWLTSQVRRSSFPGSAALRSCGLLLVGLTLACIPFRFDKFERAFGLDGRIDSSLVARLGQLATKPAIDLWAPAGSDGLEGLTRYVSECTRPEDRWLAGWFAPHVYYYSKRGFAGGQIVFGAGFLTDTDHQLRTITWLRQQSVPIIAVADWVDDFWNEYPLVTAWISARYRHAGSWPTANGNIAILLHHDWRPARQYEDSGFPCDQSLKTTSEAGGAR